MRGARNSVADALFAYTGISECFGTERETQPERDLTPDNMDLVDRTSSAN